MNTLFVKKKHSLRQEKKETTDDTSTDVYSQ